MSTLAPGTILINLRSVCRLRHIAVGDQFGKWTVIGPAPHQNNRARVMCRCSCEHGTEKPVKTNSLINASTKGCEACQCVGRFGSPTHGASSSSIYHIWHSMLQRCRLPGNLNYWRYGGRGITVCERWSEGWASSRYQKKLGFLAFCEDVGERPGSLTLDRIDNSGNYSCGKCAECLRNGWPFNIRWATSKQQSNNRKVTSYLTAFGETLPISDWCERYKMHPATIRGRLRRGWSVEKALTGRIQTHRHTP